MRLPEFFYDINSRVTLNSYMNRPRWVNEFSSPDNEEEDRIILTPSELTAKYDRDRAYDTWVRSFRKYKIRPKLMKWQVVQILESAHSSTSSKDWWPKYRDALFRVFVTPHVDYNGKDHKSWYVLSPEDAFLVHCYERESRGIGVPKRYSWIWVPQQKALRQMLLVPVECCRHWRHETKAGHLPEGL
jgi:hypothetical protein